MSDSVIKQDRRASAKKTVVNALALAIFAVAIFLAGRFSALRAVREAQDAAGVAEKERIEIQVQLDECRNALVMARARAQGPDGPTKDGAEGGHLSDLLQRMVRGENSANLQTATRRDDDVHGPVWFPGRQSRALESGSR